MMPINRKLLIFSFISIIVCSFVLYCTVPKTICSKPVKKDSARYHLNYKVRVLNKENESPAAGELHIPLPKSIFPYQEIRKLDMKPKPLKVFKDKYGNSIGIFPLAINAASEVEISLSFDATINHIYFPLNYSINDSHPQLFSEYLSDSDPFNSDSFEVRAISNYITNGEPESFYRLVKIYDYIRTNFLFVKDSNPRTIKEVLSDKRLQCCDANILFVSFCRAAGIPARFIGGLYISKEKSLFLETHSWIKAYINKIGWIPVDPTLGRFDDRSRYLCFGEQRKYYLEMWEGFTEPAVFYQTANKLKMTQILLNMNVFQYDEEKRITNKSPVPVKINRKNSNKPVFDEKFNKASENYYMKGIGWEEKNNFDEAINLFNKAIDISPEFIRAHKELIKCYFITNRGDQIYKKYKAENSKYPNHISIKYYYALCLVYMGYYSQAEETLLECEKEGFDSTEFYNSLGYIYLRTKQINKAEKAYVNALSSTGEHFSSYMNLISMFQDAEEWDKMLYWSQLGLKEFPHNSFFLSQIGYGFIRLNQPETAIGYIKDAITKDPGMGWYHAILGWALKDTGRKENAKAEIKKALSLKRGIINAKFYEDMLYDLQN